MAIVGAFARVKQGEEAAVKDRLEALGGVATFPLDTPGKIGVLVESASLDDAHAVLSREVRDVAGVLGVWPVYAHSEAVAQSEAGSGVGDGDRPQGAEQ